jgi:hypothetical protein
LLQSWQFVCPVSQIKLPARNNRPQNRLHAFGLRFSAPSDFQVSIPSDFHVGFPGTRGMNRQNWRHEQALKGHDFSRAAKDQ